MTAKQLVYLLLVGLCAAGGQFAITAAYTFAPSREISVYDYSNVIFTAISIKKIAALLGDTEKMVLDVYNHIIEENEKVEDALQNAINF